MLGWEWQGKSYEFSTGFAEDDSSSAEVCRDKARLAVRGEIDWPQDWLDIPAVVRWIGKDAVAQPDAGDQPPAVTSDKALELWRDHYAASIDRAEQISTRYKELRVLADRYDLLSLTADQAAEFVRSLHRRPVRYYSDHVAAVMGARTLTRPEIIKALEAAGVEVDRKRLTTSLINRNVFELIAEPGHHRTGKYRVRRDARKLAPRTRNDYLIACGMFYKWAVAQGLVQTNPFAGIKRAREDKHAEIIWLTRDERDQITAAADPLPCRVPVWIALYAGLRLGEIARLRWEDIDLRGRWIHVTKSKTGKTRRVPISGALLDALRPSERKSGHVCPHWQDGDYNVKAQSDILPIVKELPALDGKLRWNVFRHTFASLLAQTGKVGIDQISAL